MKWVSETIRVSSCTKKMLLRVASRLQQVLGGRVDFDEAVRYLLSLEGRRPELLEQVVGSVPNLNVEELYAERTLTHTSFESLMKFFDCKLDRLAAASLFQPSLKSLPKGRVG